MKIKVSISTGQVMCGLNHVIEIDDEELEDLDEDEREIRLQEEAEIWLWQSGHVYWQEVGEGEG